MLTGSLSVTTGLSSAPGRAVHPGAGGFSKVADEPALILRGQLSNGFNAQPRQLFARLGANAIDLAHMQRPDRALQVFLVNDGVPLGLLNSLAILASSRFGATPMEQVSPSFQKCSSG